MSSNNTVSIFLQPSISGKALPRRVVLPTTFAQLLRIARKFYSDLEINTIYDKDGNAVNRIKDFISGDTYYATMPQIQRRNTILKHYKPENGDENVISDESYLKSSSNVKQSMTPDKNRKRNNKPRPSNLSNMGHKEHVNYPRKKRSVQFNLDVDSYDEEPQSSREDQNKEKSKASAKVKYFIGEMLEDEASLPQITPPCAPPMEPSFADLDNEAFMSAPPPRKLFGRLPEFSGINRERSRKEKALMEQQRKQHEEEMIEKHERGEMEEQQQIHEEQQETLRDYDELDTVSFSQNSFAGGMVEEEEEDDYEDDIVLRVKTNIPDTESENEQFINSSIIAKESENKKTSLNSESKSPRLSTSFISTPSKMAVYSPSSRRATSPAPSRIRDKLDSTRRSYSPANRSMPRISLSMSQNSRLASSGPTVFVPKSESSSTGKSSLKSDEESLSHRILEFDFVPDDLQTLLTSCVGMLPGYKRSFLTELQEKEKKQIINYVAAYQSLIRSHDFEYEDENVMYESEMRDYANEKLLEQVFVSTIGYSTIIPRIAIYSGERTGKTTMLAAFARQFVAMIGYTQHHKDFLLLFINGNSVQYTSKSSLLGYFISCIFSSLKVARPHLISFIPGLKKSFMALIESDQYHRVNSYFQSSYHRVAILLNSYIAQLVDAYYGRTENFVELVFNLPNKIADAFKFRQVVFIIDDYDIIDQDGNGALFNGVLRKNSYIITCKNHVNFINLIGLNSCQPLIDEAHIVTPENIVEQTDYPQQLLFCIKNETIPFAVAFEDLAGVPRFCYLWEKLNIAYDEAASPNDTEDAEVVSHLKLLHQANKVLRDVFGFPDTMSVEKVIRK